MYCEIKSGMYWVWSNRKASLDCLPQYKFKTVVEFNDKILSISKIKPAKKLITKELEQRKVYEKSRQMRAERLYRWAAGLN